MKFIYLSLILTLIGCGGHTNVDIKKKRGLVDEKPRAYKTSYDGTFCDYDEGSFQCWGKQNYISITGTLDELVISSQMVCVYQEKNGFVLCWGKDFENRFVDAGKIVKKDIFEYANPFVTVKNIYRNSDGMMCFKISDKTYANEQTEKDYCGLTLKEDGSLQ